MDLKSTYLVLFNLNEVNICDQLTNLTWLFISTVACSLLVDQALAICVDLLSWGTFSVFPFGSISMLVLLYCHLSWVYGLSWSYFIHYCGVVESLVGHPHSSPFETLSDTCISRTFVSGICYMKGWIFFNHTRGWIWHLYEIFQVLWWMRFLLISRSSWVGWPMSRFHDSDFDVFIEFLRDVDYAVQVCILWLCFVFCRVSQLNILLLCGVNCHYLWDITDDDETSFCDICL